MFQEMSLDTEIGLFRSSEHLREISKKEIDRMVEDCRDREADPDDLFDFLKNLIKRTNKKEKTPLIDMYRRLMEVFDLPWEITPGRSMLYDVTMINKEGSDDPEACFNSDIPTFFATIADLENQHPKSARFLFKTYGICAFHRYGPDMLAKQFEESFLNKPYGVVWALHRDGGDGFSELSGELQDMCDQLPPGATMRILEAGDGIEAILQLMAQHRRFPNQDFLFGIVATHSHGGGNLVFGADHEDDPITGVPGAIRREHLQGTGGKRISSYFAKGAPIILMGCKSARPEGVAEALENALNLPIIAATENTTSSQITFTSWGKDFVPTVDVKYFQEENVVPTKIFSKEDFN
jgi:hypothetical protein